MCCVFSNDWQMELFFQTLTLKAWGRGLRGKGKNLTLEEANTELLQVRVETSCCCALPCILVYCCLLLWLSD